MSQQVQRGGYVDVDQIDDKETGVRAVISQRRGHTKHTFALFKVFMRDGELERTSFFDIDKHMDGIMRILPQVRDRIHALESAAERQSRRA